MNALRKTDQPLEIPVDLKWEEPANWQPETSLRKNNKFLNGISVKMML
jgi:hypothetical protein